MRPQHSLTASAMTPVPTTGHSCAAVQTTIYAPQNVSTMTEPPPSQAAGGSTTQWEIFDAYRASQEKAKAAEDQAKARSVVARKGAASAPDEQTAAELAAKVHALVHWSL